MEPNLPAPTRPTLIGFPVSARDASILDRFMPNALLYFRDYLSVIKYVGFH